MFEKNCGCFAHYPLHTTLLTLRKLQNPKTKMAKKKIISLVPLYRSYYGYMLFCNILFNLQNDKTETFICGNQSFSQHPFSYFKYQINLCLILIALHEAGVLYLSCFTYKNAKVQTTTHILSPFLLPYWLSFPYFVSCNCCITLQSVDRNIILEYLFFASPWILHHFSPISFHIWFHVRSFTTSFISNFISHYNVFITSKASLIVSLTPVLRCMCFYKTWEDKKLPIFHTKKMFYFV